MTALHLAVVGGSLASVEKELANGSCPNALNSLGETPLHLAASHGLDEIVALLLEHGADTEIKDLESGWTALHRSFYHCNSLRVALLLLQRGAGLGDVLHTRNRSPSTGDFDEANAATNLQDNDGATPLDLLSQQLKQFLNNDNGGDLYSFGKADFPLGYELPNAATVTRPRRLESLATMQITKVATSKYHSMAVTKSGQVFTWGHGRSGRLGHGDEQSVMLPRRLEGLAHKHVVDVAAAENHSLAMTAQGVCYSWGSDGFGQLGRGGTSSSSGSSKEACKVTPGKVESLRKHGCVTSIAAAAAHSAAVVDGEVFTWGCNKSCQLGYEGLNGTEKPRPVSVAGVRGRGNRARKKVLMVSAAAHSTVVVTEGWGEGKANEVYQWGHGCMPGRVMFKCGKRKGSDASLWYARQTPVNISAVSSARFHNIALSSQGQVYCWGQGRDLLGLEPSEERAGMASLVSGLPEKVVAVSASDQHTLVVSDAGDVYSWGCTDVGAPLGHGKSSFQPTARRVARLKRAVHVAAAPTHSLVLLAASLPLLPYEQPQAEQQQQGVEQEPEAEGETEQQPQQPLLSLRELCERTLAKAVDMSNCISLLAYADALNAAGLVTYCAEFIRRNLDGVLVLGRRSDWESLLETAGETVHQTLEWQGIAGSQELDMLQQDGNGKEKVDSELEHSGASASGSGAGVVTGVGENVWLTNGMLRKHVRSLKKKLASIASLEALEAAGKPLSGDQKLKVARKQSIGDQLADIERRAPTVLRAMQLQAKDKESFDSTTRHARAPSCAADLMLGVSKQEVATAQGCNSCSPDLASPGTPGAVGEGGMMFELDLTAEEPAQVKQRCEACRVMCTSAVLYAEHLRSKRHTKRVKVLNEELRLESSRNRVRAPPCERAPPEAAAESEPVSRPERQPKPSQFRQILQEQHASSIGMARPPQQRPKISRAVSLGADPATPGALKLDLSEYVRCKKGKTGRDAPAWGGSEAISKAASTSFAAILAEEESEEKGLQKAACTQSAWFIQKKPRSLSFEAIQQEQSEVAIREQEELDIKLAVAESLRLQEQEQEEKKKQQRPGRKKLRSKGKDARAKEGGDGIAEKKGRERERKPRRKDAGGKERDRERGKGAGAGAEGKRRRRGKAPSNDKEESK
ncbi:unnamed protein product [Chrysoparadoxa australica]